MKDKVSYALFRIQTEVESTLKNLSTEESISRSMQLHYIPVTEFPWTDLFLDRI